MSAPLRSLRRRRPARPAQVMDPLEVAPAYTGSVSMPDIMEFVFSDRYLDQPSLFPRQATLLKVVTLQTELFTQYDYDVIGAWGEAYERTGHEGTQPDLLDRIAICRSQGRPWFRETVAVIGRRGGKGHVGALAGSYVLWNFMHKPGGPQSWYGIERSKRLVGIVFAGKKSQAKENQWRDLTNVILGSTCFAPYISRPLGEILTIFAPTDMLRAQQQTLRGIESDADQATFELVPRESSLMAARGPASFMQYYDEMAHVVATGINRSAEEVYQAATPSLDQFGVDAFIWAASSPWQMTGRFYESYCEALARDEDGTPSYPEKFMIQLPSWAVYDDWERADQVIVRPPPKIIVYMQRPVSAYETISEPVEITAEPQHFARKRSAIQAYDDQMRQHEKANPETFAVERRAHWAAVINAYLNEVRVQEVFRPWRGMAYRVQTAGALSTTYWGHGDPGAVNDRFGYSLGHVERIEVEHEIDGEIVADIESHVVFDVLHCWDPADYDTHEVDYIAVGERIGAWCTAFMPAGQTFDQWNSVEGIQRLQRRVRRANLPKQVTVFKQEANKAFNWIVNEVFKSAINMGRVHAPILEANGTECEAATLAELELRFLQDLGNHVVDHPSSGPVQSKDVADTMMRVVWNLIGVEVATQFGIDLSGLPIGKGQAGGANPYMPLTNHPLNGGVDLGAQFSSARIGAASRGPVTDTARGRTRPPPRRQR